MTGGTIRVLSTDPTPEDGREQGTLTSEATLRIRQLILDGELEPNSRVNEVHLGETLAISRTPLRAALQTLAGEGLLIYTANRGFTVRAFALAEIIDAYTMRSLAEGLAARLAAERGVPNPERLAMEQALEDGDRLLASGVAAEDRQAGYALANERFHTAIHHASGTRLIADVLVFCRVPQVSARRLLPLSTAEIRSRQDIHHAIFLAMLCREGERAEMLMREHVASVKAAMVSALTRSRSGGG
jgi:GntR family transcriptional regulator of vanillate catabolism